MSITGLVVGLIGGGAIGSVATQVYASAHDRLERRRDRMVAAAEEFLSAYERTLKSLHDQARALNDWQEYSKNIDGVLEVAQTALSEARAGGLPDELIPAAIALKHASDLVRHGTVQEPTPRREAALAAIEAGIDALSNYSGELQDMVTRLRRVLVDVEELARRGPAVPRAIWETLARKDELVAAQARLTILFAKDGDDVVPSAAQVASALDNADKALGIVLDDDREETNAYRVAEFNEALAAAKLDVGNYSHAVNVRVRKVRP